jgi:hypothetical protein
MVRDPSSRTGRCFIIVDLPLRTVEPAHHRSRAHLPHKQCNMKYDSKLRYAATAGRTQFENAVARPAAAVETGLPGLHNAVD